MTDLLASYFSRKAEVGLWTPYFSQWQKEKHLKIAEDLCIH